MSDFAFTVEQIEAIKGYCNPGTMRDFKIIEACAAVEDLLVGDPEADPEAHIALAEAMERFGCDSIYWPLQNLAMKQKEGVLSNDNQS